MEHIARTKEKSPLQIINEHAIKEIKHKLKHSEMSMKEMANFFNFTNPSFFGKFVKQHTDMKCPKKLIKRLIRKKLYDFLD